MNKITAFVVFMAMALLALTMTSCKNKNGNGICKDLNGKKVLVMYFSRSGDNYLVGKVDKGNTAFIAEYIAEMTGADLHEVKGEKDYETFSYKQMLDIVREEGENNEFPGYVSDLDDVSNYDVIFVGGPIWWGTYPRAMFSFFRDYDMNGKTIIPFTTNEGSGLGNTIVDLKKFYSDATILDGFTMAGHEARRPDAKNVVKDWLCNLSLNTDNKNVVDASTGATRMVNKLTEKGEAMEIVQTENVEALYPDGTKENISLAVSGAVNMGEGLLWASSNVGAEYPWETGYHLAWGETKPKKSYTEDNYEYLNKNIGEEISGTWYDAARQYYGGEWRIPTHQEWHDLLNAVTLKRATINGRVGYLFIARNGNTIFLPGNGYVYDTMVGTPEEGFYWASTLANMANAYEVYLPDNSWGQSNYGRHIGLGVRAVMTIH